MSNPTTETFLAKANAIGRPTYPKPITPILSKELKKFAPHLKNSIKYNQNKNIGKLPLREILSKHIS